MGRFSASAYGLLKALLRRLACLPVVLALCGALALHWPQTGHAAEALVILESPTTRRFFDAYIGKYDLLLNQWRNFATRNNILLVPVAAEQLRTLPANTVVVLPSVVALSEKERADLEAAADRGVSMLATWAFAPRDAQGTWLGYGFMKKMFDAEVVAEVKPETEERFLQLFAHMPVTMNQLPLKRIFLGKAAEPLLKATASRSAGRFSDWSRTVHKDDAHQASLSYTEKGASRRVWFGAPETSWGTALPEIDRLLLDSLRWLQRRPLATLTPWPAPYQAAFLLEMDTEDQFSNALLFEQELSKRGLRGTFYCLTDEAVKFPDVVRRLARNHEIAYHADTHVGFKGLDPAIQKLRMQRMIAAMTPLIGDPRLATGFRTPLEDFDNNTEVVMRSVGLRHHASSLNFADVALPLFSKAEPNLGPEEALVVLPRTMLDDVNFQRMGLLEQSVSGVMINAARVSIAGGGFGLLSLHTQNYGQGSALQRDVPRLLDELAERKSSVWITSGDQIERWWRERARLSMQMVGESSASGMQMNLIATGLVRNAQVVVTVPSGKVVPKVQAQVPVSVVRLDEWRHALVFGELKAGTHAIKVSFRP